MTPHSQGTSCLEYGSSGNGGCPKEILPKSAFQGGLYEESGPNSPAALVGTSPLLALLENDWSLGSLEHKLLQRLTLCLNSLSRLGSLNKISITKLHILDSHT